MSLPININQLISGKTVELDRLEFKRGWNPEEIIRTVCAFANDINNWGGGYIVVGIAENDGIPELPPAGLSQESLDKIQKEMVNLCHQIEPFPQIISEPVEFQGKHIFIIWVPGGNERPYKAPATLGAKGQKRYFVRQGSVSKIANPAEEKQLLSLSQNIPFDDRADNVRWGKFKVKVVIPPPPVAECVMIDGVCWATCNLATHGTFADNPEDYGALFQWGRQGDGHEQRTSPNYPTNDTSTENGIVSGAANFDANGQIISTHTAYNLSFTASNVSSGGSSRSAIGCKRIVRTMILI